MQKQIKILILAKRTFSFKSLRFIFRMRFDFFNFTVSNVHNPSCISYKFDIMSNNNDCLAFPFVKLIQEIQDVVSSLGIQVSCRLICQDYRRIYSQRAGYCNDILLVVNELHLGWDLISPLINCLFHFKNGFSRFVNKGK